VFWTRLIQSAPYFSNTHLNIIFLSQCRSLHASCFTTEFNREPNTSSFFTQRWSKAFSCSSQERYVVGCSINILTEADCRISTLHIKVYQDMKLYYHCRNEFLFVSSARLKILKSLQRKRTRSKENIFAFKITGRLFQQSCRQNWRHFTFLAFVSWRNVKQMKQVTKEKETHCAVTR
jgi:hypothetical protein